MWDRIIYFYMISTLRINTEIGRTPCQKSFNKYVTLVSKELEFNQRARFHPEEHRCLWINYSDPVRLELWLGFFSGLGNYPKITELFSEWKCNIFGDRASSVGSWGSWQIVVPLGQDQGFSIVAQDRPPGPGNFSDFEGDPLVNIQKAIDNGHW